MATRGWEKATPQDTRHRRAPEKRPTLPQERRSKYRAVKTTVDGIVFDSKKEAARYSELKALQRAGKIARLVVQPRFELHATNRDQPHRVPQLVGCYVADFQYDTVPWDYEPTETIVEDVKGFKTPLYRWKKKHFEAQYGIQIRET